jgi:hypothetical protein
MVGMTKESYIEIYTDCLDDTATFDNANYWAGYYLYHSDINGEDPLVSFENDCPSPIRGEYDIHGRVKHCLLNSMCGWNYVTA